MTQEMSEQSKQAMQMMLHTMGEASRTPLMKRPSDYGLDYEDVFFPAMDGTVIEAWFIPAESDKIIVFNHLKGANRYGFPGHLEPWISQGPGFEVDFNPLYKALHEAGYNVLTYDLRGNGLSAPGPYPLIGSGLIEYRDAIGAMRYVRTREDTKDMKIAIYTQCFGANSTFNAIEKHPEEFEDVVCMMALQPLSSCAFIDGGVTAAGIPAEVWEAEYEKLTSLRTSDIDMPKCAKAITFPTFVVQVHDDFVTKPYDIQAVYDAIPVEDKKLFWIEGTNIRTECYRYFPNDPTMVIEWFDGQMK
ncbi:alpha/beta hydrolase [Ruegeria sp. HKCCD4884]|uniref:alpha/beta hydrolase n=1 Tax=Ruegeria sp. HKCCD4884 TaxID=2683022 RepID=UPI001C114EF7|nr:alpha/beta fold hydrolase [Ruegeria sp. HKCCD4884]